MAASEILAAREVRMTQTCATAKEFVDRFYKALNEERHTVKNMYEGTGKLIFNGHGYQGTDAIGKFYEELPKSNTRVVGYDAHEIDEKHLSGTPAIVISVTGFVRYGKKNDSSTTYNDRDVNPNDPKTMGFFEAFIITAKSGTWKIQSDNFRLQNSNTDSMLKSDLWSVSMQE